MPEQPDMSDLPIILTQESHSLCPSKEVLLMIIIPILVLLLAVGGAYTWSRYDYYGMDQAQNGMDQVQDGLNRIWGQDAGLKMPWQ